MTDWVPSTMHISEVMREVRVCVGRADTARLNFIRHLRIPNSRRANKAYLHELQNHRYLWSVECMISSTPSLIYVFCCVGNQKLADLIQQLDKSCFLSSSWTSDHFISCLPACLAAMARRTFVGVCLRNASDRPIVRQSCHSLRSCLDDDDPEVHAFISATYSRLLPLDANERAGSLCEQAELASRRANERTHTE